MEVNHQIEKVCRSLIMMKKWEYFGLILLFGDKKKWGLAVYFQIWLLWEEIDSIEIEFHLKKSIMFINNINDQGVY